MILSDSSGVCFMSEQIQFCLIFKNTVFPGKGQRNQSIKAETDVTEAVV